MSMISQWSREFQGNEVLCSWSRAHGFESSNSDQIQGMQSIWLSLILQKKNTRTAIITDKIHVNDFGQILACIASIITSLAKEVMFLVALELSVCLSVCVQHYSKSYERIGLKFYGGVLGSTMKWLKVIGGDLGILRRVNEQKKHHNSGGIPRSWCR